MREQTADEISELLDIATDALEKLAENGDATAEAALEEIAEKYGEQMES